MTGAEQDRHEDNGGRPGSRSRTTITQQAGASNTLHRLHAEQDQSPWIDFIDRELLTSGKLEQMVADGIRGLTSNPTIFAQGGRHRPVRRARPARDRGRRRRPPDLRGDRDRRRRRRGRRPALGLRRVERDRWLRQHRGRARPRRGHATQRWRARASCGAASSARTCSSRFPPPWPACPPSRRRSPRASTST